MESKINPNSPGETAEATDADKLVSELRERNVFIETILKNIPIGVAVNRIDSEKLTLMNKQFSEAYGWDENDFEDVKNFFSKVYPDETHRQEMAGKIRADIDSGDITRMQWNGVSVTSKSGRRRIVNARNIPIYSQNLMISTVCDVTEEVRKTEEIKRIKTSQEALINGNNDFIWSVDRDMRLITQNKRYIQFVELLNGKAIAEGDEALFEGLGTKGIADWREYYRRGLAGERFNTKTSVYDEVNGIWRYGLVSINPMYNAENEVFGISCYVKDVTDETLSLIELERTKSELEKIMQSSQDMIISLNNDNIILSISVACETILGYTQKELINKPLFNFIHPDDKERTMRTAATVMDGIAVNNFENRYLRKDGSVVHLSWSAKWDDKGQIRYGIARDITEKKKSETLLLESEKKYRSLFEYNPLPLFFWDLETFRFIDCNEAAVAKYGYTRAEFLELRTKDLWATGFSPDDQNDDGSGKPEGIYSRNRKHVKKNGEIIQVEVSGHIIEYGGKKVSLAMVNDVTDKMEAQELLNKANSLARIGAWDVDLRNNIIHWSDMTREIHEVESGTELDIETAANFYLGGIDRETIVKAMTEAAQSGKAADLELRIVTAKGNIKWVRVIVEAEFEDGICSRLYGSFQDIDKRKIAELAANDALMERNTILESIGDGFFALNKSWEITYWNKVAGKILGKPRSTVINKKLWEVFNDSIATEVYNKYYEALETKRATHFEMYYNDRSSWFEISAYPSASGLAVYFKDITDRKKADKQFLELNENLKVQANELLKSNAELEQFAYVASHDLQEPLRMVTSFLTQLENKYGDTIDDKGKQYIHFAVDGAKRMRQIIFDLLEFSRIGRVNDEVDTVDVNKLVKEVLILCKGQVEEKNAVVNFGNLPTIETFKTPLRQVLQNLISNGLKYQQPGVTPVIDVLCKETEDHWEFEVKDNGLGIDKAYFDKVFVLFQRLHSREEYSGTGIGLAIAKKIIENIGGKIWIDSELGKGTSFYFTIPKKIEI